MLLSVFPGRVLWVSYPVLRGDPAANALVVRVNRMVRDGVRSIADPRIQYLNLIPLQSESFAEYSDAIHHPGVLSEKIVRLMANVLSPV